MGDALGGSRRCEVRATACTCPASAAGSSYCLSLPPPPAGRWFRHRHKAAVRPTLSAPLITCATTCTLLCRRPTHVKQHRQQQGQGQQHHAAPQGSTQVSVAAAVPPPPPPLPLVSMDHSSSFASSDSDSDAGSDWDQCTNWRAHGQTGRDSSRASGRADPHC